MPSEKEPETLHPDFQSTPWIQTLLSSPHTKIVPELPSGWSADVVNNNLFNKTLSHPDVNGLKARLLITRPSSTPTGHEDAYIFSIGPGLDGASGRAHGGFSSVIMDHLLGTCAHRESNSLAPPATATLTVDYKKPIATPAVLLARAWVTKMEGRKIFVSGSLEDGRGGVFAVARALFVNPRPGQGMAL